LEGKDFISLEAGQVHFLNRPSIRPLPDFCLLQQCLKSSEFQDYFATTGASFHFWFRTSSELAWFGAGGWRKKANHCPQFCCCHRIDFS